MKRTNISQPHRNIRSRRRTLVFFLSVIDHYGSKHTTIVSKKLRFESRLRFVGHFVQRDDTCMLEAEQTSNPHLRQSATSLAHTLCRKVQMKRNTFKFIKRRRIKRASSRVRACTIKYERSQKADAKGKEGVHRHFRKGNRLKGLLDPAIRPPTSQMVSLPNLFQFLPAHRIKRQFGATLLTCTRRCNV